MTRGLLIRSCELLPRRDVDVARALRPRSSAEVQRLRVPGKGGARLAGSRVHSGARVDRRRPGVGEAVALRRPDVLTAEAASAVRREDDLAAVLSHVRLDVVRSRVVELHDRRRCPEAHVALLLADVELARVTRRQARAREVQASLNIGGALLVEGTVRSSRIAAEVLDRKSVV